MLGLALAMILSLTPAAKDAATAVKEVVREPRELLGTTQMISQKELGALAVHFHMEAYGTIPNEHPITIISGTMMVLSQGIGRWVVPGDTITEGLFLNPSRNEVQAVTQQGQQVHIPSLSVFGVEVVVGQTCHSCSTTCNTGMFACCNYGETQPTCFCYINGTEHSCDAGGGPGSSECSASQSDKHDLELCP